MGSTTKKALIRRFDRATLQGYVHPQTYQQAGGVEILSLSGTVSLVPYLEVKSVCFVREFDEEEERSKIFHTRPKMDGLWVRMHFRDGDTMDGILPNHLTQWEREGYLVVPPEPYSNNQRVFVPRQALSSMNVLGVVGSPLKRKARVKPVSKDQGTLFD